jgi:hypothetical protein
VRFPRARATVESAFQSRGRTRTYAVDVGCPARFVVTTLATMHEDEEQDLRSTSVLEKLDIELTIITRRYISEIRREIARLAAQARDSLRNVRTTPARLSLHLRSVRSATTH